jgi:hypothetical protein
MRRREFIRLFGCTAGAWSLVAQAQGELPSIGADLSLATTTTTGGLYRMEA